MPKNNQHNPIKASPQKIRYRRRQVKPKCTQAEASKKTGIAQSNISQYETGDLSPDLATLEKLAIAYECEVADFYDIDVRSLNKLAEAVIEDYMLDPNYSKDAKARLAKEIYAITNINITEIVDDDGHSVEVAQGLSDLFHGKTNQSREVDAAEVLKTIGENNSDNTENN